MGRPDDLHAQVSAIRSRRLARCEGCGLPEERCLCAAIPTLATRTRLALVAHHREWCRSSNTGRLLVRALPGTKVHVRGERAATPLAPLAPLGARVLVLFPDEPSRVLTSADAADDLVLVVPEGSWAQTRRALRREPWLQGERVRLPDGAPSRYRLRTAPTATAVSTFEAVARALGILEGEPIERALMAVFDEFVARSLAVRGRRAG
jgi:DTW domain-containing protein YfiP